MSRPKLPRELSDASGDPQVFQAILTSFKPGHCLSLHNTMNVGFAHHFIRSSVSLFPEDYGDIASEKNADDIPALCQCPDLPKISFRGDD